MFKSYEQIERFFNKRKHYGIKLGLDRMNRLLSLLDHPQAKIKGIHIAGTNGKGSTVAYLEQALITNSYNVGVFTSPSLTDLTGHIFLNGKVMTRKTFLRMFNVVHPAIQQLDAEGDHPTEFEIITSLAFVYFSKHTDIALIETGMGGLEDTTNCFNPILSIITNITKDHTDFLGDTITKIAKHKSGIIKRNKPVITGVIDEEARKVIVQEASKKAAPVYQLNQNFTYTILKRASKLQRFTWKYDKKAIPMTLKMQGEHQVVNCSLAIMALCLLKDQGYLLDMNKTKTSISNTSLPGRFEVINSNPQIIVDGAHNLAGMEAFLQTVQLREKKETRHLLFAGFKDKDLQGMLEMTAPYFETLTLTTFDHPRASNTEDLYHLMNEAQVSVAEDWKQEVKQMVHQSINKEMTYFVTGSMYFISIVRNFIEDLKTFN